MAFDNDMALTASLVRDFSEMINEITSQILVELKGEIERYVYDVYNPVWYVRQGLGAGFEDSWTSDSETSGNTITGTIYDAPDKMNIIREEFIHGSVYGKGTLYSDIRDALTSIIVEGRAGPLFGDGPWRQPRDFWTPMLERLDRGMINVFLETRLKARGINFVRI
jgi:hypothetical protein